jgi:hypothetical protein
MLARLHRAAAILLTVGGLSAGLSACGLSQPGSGTTETATPAAVVAGHHSAHAMFREMTHALRKIHSVSITFSVKGNKGPATKITASIEVPGRVDATVMYDGQVVNERWIGKDIYFRYNYAALDDLTGYPFLAAALHDRWIQLPPASVPLAETMEHMATDRMMQECDILGPTGKLTIGGSTTVDGLPAVSLHDHGGKPGTARRTITLSANPPYLPLRIVQTHEGDPGGPAFDDCFNNQATRTMMRRAQQVAARFNRAHHLRLKRALETVGGYNAPLHLTRPPDPLEPRSNVAQTSNSVSL